MRVFCENWDSRKPEWLTDKRTGKTIGILLPVISRRTLEASPGIQAWSNPRGKVASVQYDPASVASFAEHWERKWRKSYPLSA